MIQMLGSVVDNRNDSLDLFECLVGVLEICVGLWGLPHDLPQKQRVLADPLNWFN